MTCPLRFYSYVTRVLLDDLSDIIKTSNGSETWRNLVTYKNMLRAIESMAVEMSFGIIFIGNGKLSTADFARFIESHKVRSEVEQGLAVFVQKVHSVAEC